MSAGKKQEWTYSAALREFSKLEAVDDDPARMNTVADLVFIAQFEIDLVEAGESEINVKPHRRFVEKWKGSENCSSCGALFMPHHHFVNCAKGKDCPMSCGKTLLELMEEKCVACGRPESECSANPCAAVVEDREG